MPRFFKIASILILIIVVLLCGFIYNNLRNRHAGYEVDLNIKSAPNTVLKVGFAAVKITPDVLDTWTDANNDARYIPEDGDTYKDLNGNGRFDPVWMAGFDNRRAANGIHDDLWARTLIIDDGHTKISLTVLDAIGFMHDEVVTVRKRLNPELGITYASISSTHTHEAPDLMGLWGESHFKNGINRKYQSFVMDQIVKSIETANDNARPAYLKFAQDPGILKSLVTDSRKPEVMDEGLRLIQAIDAETLESLGTLVSWANHPETLWSDNLEITSDFPHYLREGVEKGIYLGDSLVLQGIGGICIYVNGAIGGLMTTLPDFAITNQWTGKTIKEPSFEKAQAQGYNIAGAVIETLQNQEDTLRETGISLVANTLDLPLDNAIFRLGATIGILDRGMTGWFKVQTEVAAIALGPAVIVTTPGEIYPELINGGIETPEGADFGIAPLEIPSIRDAINAEYKFVLGLTNDEIGYIIPKSEWDEEAPYIYGYEESPYGEINSMGSETAYILQNKTLNMIRELQR